MAAVPASVSLTVAASCVAEATPVTRSCRPPMRMRQPSSSGSNTGAEAVTVTAPLVAEGFTVTSGGAKRWKGMRTRSSSVT
ncbi:hypothetical protein [Azospirillum sp. SYSU D00513]|uniref:hypothetical protein n=1 Tax=Azospirillum sp. SYSU D00513 TaxID=2812561 RepID=UPI0032B55EC6